MLSRHKRLPCSQCRLTNFWTELPGLGYARMAEWDQGSTTISTGCRVMLSRFLSMVCLHPTSDLRSHSTVSHLLLSNVLRYTRGWFPVILQRMRWAVQSISFLSNAEADHCQLH